MNRLLVALTVSLVQILGADPAASSPASVCLSISASNEAPDVNATDPWTGDRTLYIWTRPCIVLSGGSVLGFVGSLEVVGVNPREAVANLGTAAAPVLVYPSCIEQATVVAEIIVRDATGLGGSVCFSGPEDAVPSCGYDCLLQCTETYAVGFATAGQDPCPLPVSRTSTSWSAVKGVFH